MENKIYKHPYFGDIYYTVYISENLKGKENLPMLVCLHGAGERGQNHDSLYVHGVLKYIKNGTLDVPGIVICPQCPTEHVWVNLASMLKEFILDMAQQYKADMSRISITGLSMGGYGTWEMLMHNPELFYKAAPICSGGTPWRAQFIKAKVWAFHGDEDNVVPVKNSYEMIDAMRAVGLNPKFTIFHGVGHGSWEPAYEDTRVIQWLFED
ncbi:MAG: prolyl oligopeptidase family serine peptidase [Clostridia bacterium]|nr:prolyl oligopeptidase family serine peptidase [Clostridia bacterium]